MFIAGKSKKNVVNALCFLSQILIFAKKICKNDPLFCNFALINFKPKSHGQTR